MPRAPAATSAPHPHAGLARALRCIQDRIHRPLAVALVAQAAALSERGLHLAFTRHLRRTPMQEIQRVRLHRAQELLRTSDDKLAAIARQVGLASGRSLHRLFQEHLGTTPELYRAASRPGL